MTPDSSVVGALPPGQSRSALVAEVCTRLLVVPLRAAVVVACSGGPDSSALAHLVADARPDLTLVLVHVAHGLRDPEADRLDRACVATHAAWLGADVVTRDVEVVRDGRGTEAAARDARYAVLREVAAERHAVAILVGHSADDQAETVLLRIARGTGTDGLAAMSVVTGDLVRPLLRIRRTDVRAFVHGEGLPTTTDPTNRDRSIRRVRVREEVLPTLARIGPDPVGTLTRMADLARDDAMTLGAVADDLPDAIRHVGPVVAIREEVLRTAPPALARRVVRRAVAALLAHPPSATTVARILDTPAGSGVTLPGGIELRVERRWRTLSPPVPVRRRVDGPDTAGSERVPLPVPGAVAWYEAGLAITCLTPETGTDAGTDATAELHENEQIAMPLPGLWAPPRHRLAAHRAAPGTEAGRYSVLLPETVSQLSVRAIAPGDRLALPVGRRRVVDVLRDAGMPRAVRARWPVVTAVDERGELVLWLPGVAVDATVGAAGRASPALALRADPVDVASRR